MTADNDKNIHSELALALPHLTPQQIAQVSPHLQRLNFPAGKIIIQQGDMADRFYILVKGRVEVWYKSTDKHDYQVAFCEAGDYFGETGLLKNTPRNSTVRVTEEGDITVLALDRDGFLAMVGESQATEEDIASEMTRRLLDLSQYS
jgi:putative ABC transport system ATP-binding protein